jgi:large subunit ribosomal protein L3
MTGLIAKKLGMTQKFAEDGSVLSLTVLKSGPCVIVQRKTAERDGYDAVQLGLVEAGRRVVANKPMEGHFNKAGAAPCRVLREFSIGANDESKVGDSIKVSVFAAADEVHVSGISKGKGFAGVMKRHGFGGQRASHGSKTHRAPGSIGQSATPARVFPGMKGPGHLGQDRVTVKNIEVIEVIEDEDLLLVKGPVPGAPGTYLEIVKKESARK